MAAGASDELLCILFTDLVGWTALGGSVGDDEADGLRRKHFEVVRAALDRHRGREVKTVGDGVLATFRSALEAVRCGIAIQAATATTPVQVRVGIDAGEPIDDDGDVFGTPVNVASRLCAAAQPGEVLVSDLVRSLVGRRGGVAFDDGASFDLKGVRAPVLGYRARLAGSPEPTHRPAPIPPTRPAKRSLAQLDRPLLCAELVERDRELEVLSAAVASLPGTGGLVVLAGEAGVGKTRLTRDATRAAEGRGTSVLSGRSVPGATPVPFRPLTEALLGGFRDSSPLDSPELRGYEDQVGRLVPQWRRGVPGGADESPVLVGEAVVRLLRVVGGSAGCVLVLEDLHWADVETLAVVEYLADVLPREPATCICTARPEDAAVDLLARVRRLPHATVLGLSRLGPQGIERAVASCLGDADPPADLVESIASNSEGNPFLIEELLAGLVASGSLRLDDGRWNTTGRLVPSIPFDFAESMRQRLAELDATARVVLGAAALLGRRFDWELLPGIAEVDGRAAADALRAAVDQQLIDVDGDGFVFRHALTREAVLADLLPPERRRLASRARPAVERANPGLPGPILELVADLAEAAGEPAIAAACLAESCRRALAAGAFTSAEAAARRAQPLAADEVAIALDVDEALVHVLVAAGKASEAIALGRSLAGRLHDAGAAPQRQTDLLVVLAHAAAVAGDVESGQEAADEARAAAGPDPDPAVLARIDAVAAELALDRAQLETAEELCRRAIDGARATDQPAVECEALIVLGRVLRASDVGRSLEAFELAAEVASSAGLPRWHLRAQHELALEAWVQKGAAPMEETRALAARYGAHITVAVLDLSLADVALSRYDRDATLRHATACVEASRRFGLATEPVAQLWLAGAHALGGDDDAMQAAIDASLAKDPDDPRILGDLYGRVLATRAFVRDELASLRSLHDTMMEHVRRAPPTTSIFPGRILWMLLHTIDDDDLGAAAREEFAEVAARVAMPWYTHALAMGEAVILGRQGAAAAAQARMAPAYDALAQRPLNHGTVHANVLEVARAAIRDRWGEPARWLRESEAFFAANGYDRLARRARTLLAEAGAPVPRRRGGTEVPQALRAMGVTGREVEVLQLVVEGRSNKEIAAELVLSPKTVERHLSSLFTRLGVANRRDLAGVGGPLL